jgi:hypothetical protein
MKMSNRLISGAALLTALMPAASAQEYEKRVRMNSLPGVVRKTVLEQSKGAVIRGLSKEVENGKTFYEVELKVAGHNKDILIDSTGAIVEIEEQVELSSLPPAVRATIEAKAGSGKVMLVESITKGGAIVAYEAHVKTGTRWSEIVVGTDGQLIPPDK